MKSAEVITSDGRSSGRIGEVAEIRNGVEEALR